MNKKHISLNDIAFLKVRHDIPVLLNNMLAENICEIGVRNGEHFSKLMIDCIKNGIAVDIWTNTGNIPQNDERSTQDQLDIQYNIVLEMSKNDPRIEVIKDFSVNASQKFADEYFDFVYIDADHTESAVNEDICAWWSKVRSGGILAGHDYAPAIVTWNDYTLKFGVIEAVNKFVAKHGLQLHFCDANWFIPKP